MLDSLKELYQFRELLINLTIKELKLKYKNSAIGFFWSFLNPLMMLVIYSFAFKLVMRIKLPNYPVYILSGLLPWMFLQASTVTCTISIVANAGLLKKVYFPREIIPLSYVLANFINFLMTLIVLFVGVAYFKIGISWALLALPLMLLIIFIFATGIGLILAAYTVTYRDLSHVVEIIFMGWFYITPIIYSFKQIPDPYKKYLILNPATAIIEGFHNIILDHKFPDLKSTVISLAISLALLIIGMIVFKKKEVNFAEEA